MFGVGSAGGGRGGRGMPRGQIGAGVRGRGAPPGRGALSGRGAPMGRGAAPGRGAPLGGRGGSMLGAGARGGSMLGGAGRGGSMLGGHSGVPPLGRSNAPQSAATMSSYGQEDYQTDDYDYVSFSSHLCL